MAPLKEQQMEQIHPELRRREQIKKAALKVFARNGVVRTKMSMIAAEAGISQGLSYRYFSSKDELFTELIKEAMEEAEASVGYIKHLPGTLLEQIRTLTEAMLHESNQHSFLLIQQAITSDEVPEKAKEIIKRDASKDMIDQLVPIFIKGQEAGELCSGDPRKLLFFYFSVIKGLMLQEVQTNEDDWIQYADLLIKLITK
ncbi:MAG: TetR family transcriptional regulator [Bacilli bacterium]|nr:TetR family transcriptional regulator [Bacilli bacterium]